MKIYKYWVRDEGVLLVDGAEQKAVFYGRSNLSEDDARRNAGDQRRRVQDKILGKEPDPESYEVCIREEILEQLDPKNLVTRNRYGARVLNSENVVFVDIDEPRVGLLQSLFGGKRTKTEQIVAMVEKVAAKPKYAGFGFRLYQTFAGVRMVVYGPPYDPSGDDVRKLMRDFNADPLYAMLCTKQACFRARLSPKPYRMKHKAKRIRFPRTAAEDAEVSRWVVGYSRASEQFAVCRHIVDIGRFRATGVVDYHDRATGAFGSKPLA